VVFDSHGREVRRFVVGDGIEHVQTTACRISPNYSLAYQSANCRPQEVLLYHRVSPSGSGTGWDARMSPDPRSCMCSNLLLGTGLLGHDTGAEVILIAVKPSL
jgi:hypothetical protein